jgi:spermidine synthase
LQERENYRNSRVLILGGGDGGLLKELYELPNPPREIIMVELDQGVLDAADKHLRWVCTEEIVVRMVVTNY